MDEDRLQLMLMRMRNRLDEGGDPFSNNFFNEFNITTDEALELGDLMSTLINEHLNKR